MSRRHCRCARPRSLMMSCNRLTMICNRRVKEGMETPPLPHPDGLATVSNPFSPPVHCYSMAPLDATRPLPRRLHWRGVVGAQVSGRPRAKAR